MLLLLLLNNCFVKLESKPSLICVQATSKPHSVTIQDRMSLAQSHIIESSPVWETLRDIL